LFCAYLFNSSRANPPDALYSVFLLLLCSALLKGKLAEPTKGLALPQNTLCSSSRANPLGMALLPKGLWFSCCCSALLKGKLAEPTKGLALLPFAAAFGFPAAALLCSALLKGKLAEPYPKGWLCYKGLALLPFAAAFGFPAAALLCSALLCSREN
jgi:hypothetical protein